MLETIWFILWGTLWAVYFMLDGFDLGLGTLLPFLGKTDQDRRVIYNAMGPFWDGNEVWLITAGGVTFAAFPTTYAVMFSSLYSALMLVLFALILRGVVFEFRSKLEHAGWRRTWDWIMFIGSVLPAFLFGVAFANIFAGIPIDQNGVNQGYLLGLLNVYGLIGGFLFLFLFVIHGACWLAIKSSGELAERAMKAAGFCWPFLLAFAVIFLGASAAYTDLWANYADNMIFLLVPLLAVVTLLSMRLFFTPAMALKAWILSAITIVACTAWGVIGLFPRLLPSSLNPEWSMTIYNSASSQLTLSIMLGVALVMVPVVIAYQAYVYYLFSHKIDQTDLDYAEAY